ncbi:MAG: hypothetical protein V2B20_22925 [Pseudomonadota bacterium]
MKYYYTISKYSAFTSKELNDVLPKYFSIQENEQGIFLVVEKIDRSDQAEVFSEVQRECDRIYFLTGEKLNPILIRIEESNGSGTGYGFLKTELDAILIGYISSEIDRQQWQNPLAKQLRLFYLAELTEPIAPKMNLYFQIIEASYPNTNDLRDYPEFKIGDIKPHPRTETKLLRDFVSHQKNKISSSQLKLYCQYLGINEEFYNPTDTKHIQIVKSKLSFIREEARKIIDVSITRKPMVT